MVARLVVAVAAAGVMVVQRGRWIGTELMGDREGSKMGSRRLVVAAAKSGKQRRDWHRHRRRKMSKARAASVGLSRNA